MQTINFHNVRDSKGRFISKNKAPKQQKPSKLQTTHYIYVLDRSGSMSGCMKEACKTVNTLANTVLSESAKYTNLQSLFSLITFDSTVTLRCDKVDSLPKVDYSVGGQTALNDAIALALKPVLDPSNKDIAYQVTVITDGDENASNYFPGLRNANIERMISDAYATDRFTLGFNCPPGKKQNIANNYGVPLQSINEWENSVAGSQFMASTNVNATTSYVATRSAGVTKTLDYYSIDASKFQETKRNRLTRFSPKHRKVEKECSISEFFGNEFYPGKGYYELTKAEKIQHYKGIVIQEKTTGNYYKSSPSTSVREFLGLPIDRDSRVDPLNLGYYKVFVQSTSENRKLVRGTTVIWQ